MPLTFSCLGYPVGTQCTVDPPGLITNGGTLPVQVTFTTASADIRSEQPVDLVFKAEAGEVARTMTIPLVVIPAVDAGERGNERPAPTLVRADVVRPDPSVEVPHLPAMPTTGPPPENRPAVSVCVVADDTVKSGGMMFRLRNQTKRSLTLQGITVPEGFVLDENCHNSLSAGESCTVHVTRRGRIASGKGGLKITTDAGEVEVPVRAPAAGARPLSSCETHASGSE